MVQEGEWSLWAVFEFFYNQSSERYEFYRTPKALFQEERFQGLSTDAKTLYGILLDRISLSRKNGWFDEQGRTYIIFTVEEIMDCLHCGNKKACKLLDELEKIGLLLKKRQGQGKPSLLYLRDFSWYRDEL